MKNGLGPEQFRKETEKLHLMLSLVEGCRGRKLWIIPLGGLVLGCDAEQQRHIHRWEINDLGGSQESQHSPVSAYPTLNIEPPNLRRTSQESHGKLVCVLFLCLILKFFCEQNMFFELLDAKPCRTILKLSKMILLLYVF